jgi:predicted acyl esterase
VGTTQSGGHSKAGATAGATEEIEVLYTTPRACDDPSGRYPGFAPGSEVVEGGILFERDVAVPLRDGVVMYTDIFRPEGATDIPAIVAWSPYGKRGGTGTLILDDLPGRAGVPREAVSDLAKFEAPDPAYWCPRGYAIVNPDTRGAFKSEGDAHFWGTSQGRDGYDLVEWLAEQDWCNGRISFSGNSWLAIAQWFIAAERPPHLAAIAPWEGFSDFYRHSLFPGGIPEVGMIGWIQASHCGSGRLEDVVAMMERYPFPNAYWSDRTARLEDIDVPAYVVASWTNVIHTPGTFAAFRGIPSQDKWLRVHNTHEWPDYYRLENVEDLRRFYDRYLKGIDNGWESTPRVRIAVLDPGALDEINRPEDDFPLARAEQRKLFLDAVPGRLHQDPPAVEAETRYAADEGQAVFTYTFTEDTEITGYLKLRLWVEAAGADDLDLFVVVQKLDEQGNLLGLHVPGPPLPQSRGWLRVSRRGLDEAASTPSEPVLAHAREQLLSPGEIVPVEIALTPISMRWHAGQQLRLIVAGHNLTQAFEPFQYQLRNRGEHVLHAGGRYDSHLMIPVIPA